MAPQFFGGQSATRTPNSFNYHTKLAVYTLLMGSPLEPSLIPLQSLVNKCLGSFRRQLTGSLTSGIYLEKIAKIGHKSLQVMSPKLYCNLSQLGDMGVRNTNCRGNRMSIR